MAPGRIGKIWEVPLDLEGELVPSLGVWGASTFLHWAQMRRCSTGGSTMGPGQTGKVWEDAPFLELLLPPGLRGDSMCLRVAPLLPLAMVRHCSTSGSTMGPGQVGKIWGGTSPLPQQR